MEIEELRELADSFFEWPTEDRTQVTLTSALLFAQHVLRMAQQAHWNSSPTARDWEMKAQGIESVIHYVVSKSDQSVLRHHAAEKRAEAKRVENTAPQAQPEAWRCFHCDEVFTDRESAQEHFGVSQYKDPACQIDIAKYRDMEETLRRFHNEDTDQLREIHALYTEKTTAVRRAEEQGYAKGLEDARKHPEELGLIQKPAQIQTGWKPIETAPKGYPILLSDGHGVHVGFWDVDRWITGITLNTEDGGARSMIWVRINAVCWMEIPQIHDEFLRQMPPAPGGEG